MQNKFSFSVNSSCLIIVGVEGCCSTWSHAGFTLSWAPLDEKSARCRGVNLKTENTCNGHA
jgi:hypothetical protein